MKRREAIDKLTGREAYIDDIAIAGVWWGCTVRSAVPRGRIRDIRFGAEIDWSEFVVVDHRDLPGPNQVAMIENDQPVLASDRVRHIHEAVLLLAHPDRDRLREARRAIHIEIDEEPAIFDYRVPPPADTVQHGGDNVFKRVRIDKGDVDAALVAADHVVEGVYETGAQEHVYLENQGMVGYVEDGVVTVKGSMQCPYYIHAALRHALARADNEVRVIQAATGGGFGGKEDYPSVLALHAALLALKAERPVKILYDRDEDMAATTKRHPARVRHRTGVTSQGRIVAQDIEVLLDGGAYVTLSPVVLSRGVIHASGPYHCDNVRVEGRAVLTNAVPFGAFRGFGAPQTIFACERHMDVIADELGMCPLGLRRKNLIQDGQSTSTGQVIRDGTDRIEILDRAVRDAEFHQREAADRAFNSTHPYLRRATGIATFYHGAGFTGAGETYLDSRAQVVGLATGEVEIRTANVEMGQGALTTFVKIVAEKLAVEPDRIRVAEVDTFHVPNSGPTVASRTSMIVGRLLERGCDALCATLGGDWTGDKFERELLRWHAEHPGQELIAEVRYEPPPGVEWDDERYEGSAYGTFAWATYAAHVEVDLRTFGVRLLDFVAVQDVGTVLDEVLAAGQVQGGVVQGVGWALMEECQFVDGAMANHNLTNYSIPSSDDVPPVRVVFYETPYAHGAQGAKGIGELPMDGAAPAIVNAVARATGARPAVVPLTPEVLMRVMGSA